MCFQFFSFRFKIWHNVRVLNVFLILYSKTLPFCQNLTRGFTCGHVAAAPGPLVCLAAALGPLACPSRSARPRNCLNLTKPSNNREKKTVVCPILQQVGCSRERILHTYDVIFLQIAEIAADGRRDQIFMTLSTAAEFRDHLTTFR